MNIVNKLTLRHLKLNRKRTLVTIVGVIISVTMITAVATFAESFMATMRQNQINTGGNWHVVYNDVPADKVDLIRGDEDTKNTVLSRDEGYAKLETPTNKKRPYLFIRQYNQQGFTNFPVTLTEGRLPQNESEILLPENLLEDKGLSCQVGDTLTLELGTRSVAGTDPRTQETLVSEELDQRTPYQKEETFTSRETKSFTVVGVVEQPRFEMSWSPGYTVFAGLDESALTPQDVVKVSVELKTVNRGLYQHAQQLAEQLGFEGSYDIHGNLYGYEAVDYNDSLLQYSGVTENDAFQQTFYRLCAIVIGIIIIGSVSLIYNAFSISISERSRYLGMLASVGATKAQKRKSVFFEGALIGAVSIPLGILFGLGGMWVTFQFINPLLKNSLNDLTLQLHISWLSILVAVAFSIFTILLSTWIPARRASRITPIEAIRQTKDVKLKGKNLKTSRLTAKLFGFEAELALKNLKRNKRRYKATIFSLAISILLFLSVASFMQMFVQANKISTGEIDYNLSASMRGLMSDNQEFFTRAAALPDAGESLTYEETDGEVFLDEEKVSDLTKSNLQPALKGEYNYSVNLFEFDEASFARLCKQAGIDASSVQGAPATSAILLNWANYQEKETSKYVEGKATNLRPGDSVQFIDHASVERSSIEVQIAGVVEQFVPLLGNPNRVEGTMTLVVPRGTIDALRQDVEPEYRNSLLEIVFNSPNPDALEKDLETLSESLPGSDVSIMNIDAQVKRLDQATMVMLVFAYGFIILISAICVANIFNTISTSIQLRKREFAMLKSVGMTSKGFNRMLNYESIFYGLKALLYGLPLSFAAMYLMYKALAGGFSFRFAIPWVPLLIAVAAVFLIVGSTMLYSGRKVKRENIIDALKEENI